MRSRECPRLNRPLEGPSLAETSHCHRAGASCAVHGRQRASSRAGHFSHAPHHADRAVPAGRLDRRRRTHRRRQDGSVRSASRLLWRMSAAPAARSASGGWRVPTPDGYTIDIGQWDTHVGSIIYNLNYDLQTDFEPIGLVSNNPQLLVAKKALPADDLKALVAWMKQNPGDAKFVNQNASAQVSGLSAAKAHRHQSAVHSLSRRRPGDDRSDLRPGRSSGRARRGDAAADPRRHHQGDRQHVAAALRRDPGHPDLRRSRRARPLYVGMVRPVRAQGHAARPSSPSSTTPWWRRWPIRKCACGSPSSGSISPRATQQTPVGLAAFHKAEIEKWWPIIKAAGIRGE